MRGLRPERRSSRARRRAAPTASPSSRWPRRTRRSPRPAGPTARPTTSDRVGCILGTGIGGIGTLEDSFGVLRDQGPGRVAPLAVPLMMSNAGAAAIAMRHDFRGPVFGVVSACAAGANAIAAATRAIQCGDADAVVTGGSEAALHAADARRVRRARRALAEPASAGRSTPAATASSWARAPACSCSRTPSWPAPAAPRSSAIVRGVRRDLRRPPPDRPAPGRRGRRRRDDRRAARRRPRGGATSTTSTPTAPRRRSTTARRRWRSSPRWARTPAASRSRRRSPRSATCSAPPARSRRSPRSSRCASASRRRRSGSSEPDEGLDLDYVPGSARGPGRRGRARRAIGDLQLVRLRRPQRGPRPGGGMTARARRPPRRAAHRARAPRGALRPGLAATCCAPQVRSRRMGDRAQDGDGVLGASGRVDGRPIFCFAQDRSFAGGSLGEAHADTVVRVLRLGRPRAGPGRRVHRVGGRADAGGPRRLSAATAGSSASTSRCRASCRRSRSSAAPRRAAAPTPPR